jgi:hypothetical protein
LDIELPAGDYWVSLTPRHNLGILPYTFHIIASGPVIGDPAPSIVACTVNSDWVYSHPSHPDYAMKIEGEFHLPTATQADRASEMKSPGRNGLCPRDLAASETMTPPSPRGVMR